jgi:DivIVA domain-containing protein
VVLSFSRPDPSSPTAVAGATFSASRRGYDQDEVRDFLRMVSAELSRLHERVVFLERELADRPQGTSLNSREITEDSVVELLGEETARIVQTAREAAHKIKARSEETAAKLIREATEEAARIREESELDCARRRQDANADAEAEVLMAKQQGRDMVNEARAYRERVLADVARRREMAREQLEDLFHGRDRLVQAFERARTATDDVLRDLDESADEPTEFINLAPTTGPVPVIVQADEVERAEALRPASSSAPSFAPYDQDDDRDQASHSDSEQLQEPSDSTQPVVIDDSDPVHELVESSADEVHLETVESVEDNEDEQSDTQAVAPESPVTPVSNVVSLFARTDSKDPVAVEEKEESVTPLPQKSAAVKADDIFARLRRASTEVVAKDASSHQAALKNEVDESSIKKDNGVVEAIPAPVHRVVTPVSSDTACFTQRDEVLVPVIVAMSRKIKRVLADEQNLILDALRAKQPVKTLELLVGSKADHSARFTKALEPLLGTATLAGARSLSDAPDAELKKKIHQHRQAVDEYVIANLVTPLRERLSRSISEASGSNAELASSVRLVYREWKNHFVDEHIDDVALNAYGRGALAVLNEKANYCWMVDPDGPACSDAEDNSLAGAVQGGAEFPTGHTHAPAHPGCRCALIACNN